MISRLTLRYYHAYIPRKWRSIVYSLCVILCLVGTWFFYSPSRRAESQMVARRLALQDAVLEASGPDLLADWEFLPNRWFSPWPWPMFWPTERNPKSANSLGSRLVPTQLPANEGNGRALDDNEQTSVFGRRTAPQEPSLTLLVSARVELVLGNWKESLGNYEQLLVSNQTNMMSVQELIAIARLKGQRDTALALCEQALSEVRPDLSAAENAKRLARLTNTKGILDDGDSRQGRIPGVGRTLVSSYYFRQAVDILLAAGLEHSVERAFAFRNYLESVVQTPDDDRQEFYKPEVLDSIRKEVGDVLESVSTMCGENSVEACLMLSAWASFESTFGDLRKAYTVFHKAYLMFADLTDTKALSYRDVGILCYALESLAGVYPYTDVRAKELLYEERDLITRTFGPQHARLIPVLYVLCLHESLLHQHYAPATLSQMHREWYSLVRQSLSREQRSSVIGTTNESREAAEATRIQNKWKQSFSIRNQ